MAGIYLARCTAWAEAEFNDLMLQITRVLEAEPGEDLLRRRAAEMKLPAAKNHRKR